MNTTDLTVSLPVLWMTGAALAGLGVGAALMRWLNIRKYRGTSRSFELTQRLEDAELRYKKELASKESNQAFFANMSHELRTPFQGLLGMLDLIGDSPLNDAQREYLTTAQRSAHHLLGVLNDILDVSAMDSGMFSLSVAPMSLRQVAHDAEALMGTEARKKGLILSVNCDPEVPPWVAGDETRVRQILFNLLSNAKKFTTQGRITIRLRRSNSRNNGIIMSVQDTGVGMDEETQRQLFTRFFQADSSLRRRMGGTGLGLEISRNLARMMDGDIHVASQPGVGTTFTVLLILPACEPSGQTAFSELMPLPSEGFGNTGFPQLHFLVAEDHPINTQYLTHLLNSMGHRATLCDNGREALALAQKEDFDAALLDYHMPELDGLAVTRAIRAGPAPFASLKILLITADVVNDTRQLASEAGVDGFLSKPLKKRDLQRALMACGLYEPRTGNSRRGQAHPQFRPSDYEMPMYVDSSVSNTRVEKTSLVDWATLQELIEVMTHQGLERQLQAVFRPDTGALAECTAALGQGNLVQQRAALHKLKGTLLLLGLEKLANCCAKGEDMLRQEAAQPLPADWVEELLTLAETTREELTAHFQLAT
jgi:two-component system, sensor histidine kinase